MTQYMIETKSLTKKFGDFTAANKINIRVKKGTIHGFIGPNGAGKTTTMKMIIGALNPTNGSGSIAGHPLGSVASRKVFGYSPEHPRFYTQMSAFDYLVYMGRASGMSKADASKRANEMLLWLELDDFASKKIGGFSAGMRQKLGLAQAMIHEPDLLILDEPTANLDPAGRSNIIKKLKELSQKKGVTIFISSHILSELEKLVDEVTILSHGSVVTEGDIESLESGFEGGEYLLQTPQTAAVLRELKSKPFVSKAWKDESGTIHVVSSGDDTEFKKKVLKLLVSCDAQLDAFGAASSDLEAVFMNLVGEEEQHDEKKKKGKFDFLKRWRR